MSDRVRLRRLSSFVLLAALAGGCAETPAVKPSLRDPDGWEGRARSKRIDTAGAQNEWVRTGITHPDAVTLPFRAFLVGIEKGNASAIGASPGRGLDTEKFGPPKRSGSLRLNDGRAMFLAHVVDYPDTGREAEPAAVYDVYSTTRPVAEKGEWAAGQVEIDALLRRVRQAAIDTKATHLILWSTGWNNSASESVATLRSLHNVLAHAAEADGKADDFRPLYVAFTWASYWHFPGIFGRLSLFTKGNDADELGAVWGGAIVNRVLMPVRRDAPTHPKIVVVGHSLGARVVTWAALSGNAGAAGPAPADGPVDLLVGLQGAFSVRRFVEGKDDGKGAGKDEDHEGAPFADTGRIARRVLFTCSARDEAVNYSLWSKYVGNDNALGFAARYSEVFRIGKTLSDREVLPARLDAPLDPRPAWDRVWLINATSIISKHNDVAGYSPGEENNAVGSLIWQALPW